MTRLSVSLLGPFEVSSDGRTVPDLNLEKAQAVLAYLVVEANLAHRRDVLATLLWPEADESRARANLRQVLHKLRSSLGDVDTRQPIFFVTARTIHFQRTNDDWIDVEVFTSLLDSCRAHQHEALDECPECLERMRQAVEIYQGDFLAGLSLPDSVPYQEWAVAKQAELHNYAVNTLAFLAAHRERTEDYEVADRYVRRLLELEPWNEDAHRRRMSILVRSGQRLAALKQYEVCRRTLVAEFGVEPATETKALYTQIHDGDWERGSRLSSNKRFASTVARGTVARETVARETVARETVARETAPPATDIPDASFVGFEQELSALNTCLSSTVAGHGQLILIAGERGSGKATLVAEFIRQAMQVHGNLLCAHGSARQPVDASDHYSLLRETLATLTGGEPDIGERATTSHLCAYHNQAGLRQVLHALDETGINSIEAMLGNSGALENTRGSTRHDSPTSMVYATSVEYYSNPDAAPDRQSVGSSFRSSTQLVEQIARFLHMVAHTRPVLFVCENLQWADEASLAMLRYLPRRLTDSCVLFVLTYDSSALYGGDGAGQRLLHAIESDLLSGCSVYKLDLDQRDGRSFLNSFLRSELCDLSQQLSEELFRYTLGHPLFTIETLRALKQNGSLVQIGTGRWVEGPAFRHTKTGAPEWGGLPRRAEAIICERLERLLPEHQALLEAAAVQGEVFCAEILARVRGTDEERVTQCLSDLLGREERLVCAEGILYLHDQRLSQYRFRRPILRKYLYNGLDSIRRARLHEATARALETLSGSNSAEVAEQLAFHFEAAGIFAKAVFYRRLAAEAALERSEYQDAFEQLSAGLAHVPFMQDTHARINAELQLQLGLNVALSAMDGWGAERRQKACMRALDLCQLAGDTPSLFWTLFALADLARFRADHARAPEWVEQMLVLAQRAGKTDMIALAEVSLGETYFLRGDLLSARRHLMHVVDTPAVQEFARVRTKTGLDMGSVSLSRLAWTLWSLGFADQARVRCAQALVLADQHPLSQAYVTLFGHFCVSWLSRQLDQALEVAAQFERLVTGQNSLAFMQPWYNIVRGWAHCYRHSSDDGIAVIRQGIAEWETSGANSLKPLQLLVLADAYACAGDPAGGLCVLDEARSLMERCGVCYIAPAIYHLKGKLLIRQRVSGDQQIISTPHVLYEAEVALNVALALARAQQAKMWELRTTLTLSKLLLTQNRNDEARSLLSPIYAWFTEGFDLPDLRDARALLEQIG